MALLAPDFQQNGRLRGRRSGVGAFSLGAAAVLALALAGCGGHYTKQNFVQSADGICLSTTRAVRLLTAPQFTGTAARQQQSLGKYLTRVAPLLQSKQRRLAALRKPPGTKREQRLLAQWLAAEHASAISFKKLAVATSSGNSGAVANAGAELAAVPVVRLAAQYGAHACAAPGATYTHAP
jgi:hypothetical protein